MTGRFVRARRAARAARSLARRAWPLSPSGTATLALAIAMWARSAAEENAAGLMFPIFLLVAIFAAVAATRGWHAAAWVSRCSWSLSETPRQGDNARAFAVTAPADRGPPPFLRVTFAASGTLSSASRRLFRVSAERRAIPGETVEIALPLPASGELSLRAGFVVRDALGLARRSVGVRQRVESPVFPATGQDFPTVDPDASASSERSAVSKKSEGEKIFIREYVPGDLARDVNWKALARTGVLLTRVPPESPKETRVLRLAFLAPGPAADPFARGRSLVAIDHLRTLAASFMLAVRKLAPDYAFSLTVGEAEFFADAEDSLDGLFAALSRAGFSSDADRRSAGAVPEGAWVFASSSDAAARASFGALLDAGCRLVLSVGPSTDARSRSRTEDERRDLSLFAAFPVALPLPQALAALAPQRARDAALSRPPRSAFAAHACGVRP